MGVRQWWDLRVAKRGRTRSRSALCGVLAFDQNLGLWPALLGGIGWIVAFDHGGYGGSKRSTQQERSDLFDRLLER